MSVRHHRWGRGRIRAQAGEEPGRPMPAPPGRREMLRRVLAGVLMAVLVLPLLGWLSWPLGLILKANPFILAGLVAGPGVILMAALWIWRASSARQVLRRGLLTMAVVALLLPLNGVPFLISEMRLAQGGSESSAALASSTAAGMALLMTVEDAIAGIVVAAVSLVVRWVIRPKGERGRRKRR